MTCRKHTDEEREDARCDVECIACERDDHNEAASMALTARREVSSLKAQLSVTEQLLTEADSLRLKVEARLSESRAEVAKLRATAMELREALSELREWGEEFFDDEHEIAAAPVLRARRCLARSAYLMANTKETER